MPITADKGAECPHDGYRVGEAAGGRRLFYRKDTTMTAGQRADGQRSVAVSRDGQARPSEHKSAAVDLRAENESLRAQLALRDHALDATPSFFVITRQEDPAPIIVYCNKIVADTHGYAREELIGKPITLLTQWIGGNPSFAAEVQAALTAGQTVQYEDEVTRPDGTTFWLGLSIRPLYDSAGRYTHAVTVGADITAKRIEMRKKQELQDKLVAEMEERERMVIELQLAQKLESVGRLAAGIAHEINTPIQYVGDSVYFLRSAFEDFDMSARGNAAAASDVAGSARSVPPMQQQIAELEKQHDLEFLRAEVPQGVRQDFRRRRESDQHRQSDEGIRPSGCERAEPRGSQSRVANHAAGRIERVQVSSRRCSTEFGELPQVVCNVGELNQVFLEPHRQRRPCDPGRRQGRGQRRDRISTALGGDTAEIRISDNGCGVPAENLGKLYDPFFTTKEVGRGTGQGLAITHSILVDKHGGDISVCSTVGIGTEFTLRLPIGGRGARASA